MMPWQQFDKSRQSEPLYNPLDPIKNWFARQTVATQTVDNDIPQPVFEKSNEIITYPLADTFVVIETAPTANDERDDMR